MYAAEVKGRRLNFTVSGMLWNRSLIMQDVETRTLWSHILGRAMEGNLMGEELEVIPSVMTDWQSWKADHPQSTVLAMSRTSREYVLEFQKKPGRFVLGLVWRGKAKAYPFDALQEYAVLNDQFQDHPLVVTFDAEGAGGRIFSRRVDGRVLGFQAAGAHRMKDLQTGSVWDSRRGVCLEGQMKGKQIKAMPAVISFKRVWKIFHPETRVYQKP